jgi:hypothetical protein
VKDSAGISNTIEMERDGTIKSYNAIKVISGSSENIVLTNTGDITAVNKVTSPNYSTLSATCSVATDAVCTTLNIANSGSTTNIHGDVTIGDNSVDNITINGTLGTLQTAQINYPTTSTIPQYFNVATNINTNAGVPIPKVITIGSGIDTIYLNGFVYMGYNFQGYFTQALG